MGTERTITENHKLLDWEDKIKDAIPNDGSSARFDIIKTGDIFHIEMFTDSRNGTTPDWGIFDIPLELIQDAISSLNDGSLVLAAEINPLIYRKLEKQAIALDTSKILDDLGASEFKTIGNVKFYMNLFEGEENAVDIQYMDGPQRKTLTLTLTALNQIIKIK